MYNCWRLGFRTEYGKYTNTDMTLRYLQTSRAFPYLCACSNVIFLTHFFFWVTCAFACLKTPIFNLWEASSSSHTHKVYLNLYYTRNGDECVLVYIVTFVCQVSCAFLKLKREKLGAKKCHAKNSGDCVRLCVHGAQKDATSVCVLWIRGKHFVCAFALFSCCCYVSAHWLHFLI